MSQDEQDTTKWDLAEAVALGANQIESAVLRFGDGASHAVEPSLCLLDPTTQSHLDLAQTQALLDEMLEANRAYLPLFFR